MAGSLLVVWQDVCELFKWNNAKLFLLATLNTFVNASGLVLRYFWGIIITLIVMKMFGFILISDFLTLILSFAYLLSVRPSIENKSLEYYLVFAKKFFLYGFMALIVISCVFIPYKIVSSLLNFPFKYPGTLIHGPFSFIGIAGFFLLDGSGRLVSVFTSLKSAIKFVWYCLPLVAVIFLFEGCIIYYTIDVANIFLNKEHLDASWKVFMMRGGFFIIRNILSLLLFSSLSTLYTKIKHGHYKLFFTR